MTLLIVGAMDREIDVIKEKLVNKPSYHEEQVNNCSNTRTE